MTNEQPQGKVQIMTTLAAYTGPTPATGYVGFVNFTLRGNEVVITVRPESADGSGTASLAIPVEAADDLARAILSSPEISLSEQIAERDGVIAECDKWLAALDGVSPISIREMRETRKRIAAIRTSYRSPTNAS